MKCPQFVYVVMDVDVCRGAYYSRDKANEVAKDIADRYVKMGADNDIRVKMFLVEDWNE